MRRRIRRLIRLTPSALALVGSLSVASAARAGCCDDFWSCLGAVASAGLSCQVQALIDTVNAMKTLVETVTNDLRTRTGDIIAQAQKGVSDSTADMKQVREQSVEALAKAAARAHEIANPPRGMVAAAAVAAPVAASPMAASPARGAAPQARVATGAVAMQSAGKPADAKAVQDELNKADGYLQDLKGKANAPQNDVANAERAAAEAALRHVHIAQQIGIDLAIAPLNMLRDSLVDLLTHPERIFDPSAQIEADIQRITTEVPALFDKIANEVTAEAMGDLERVKGTLQQLQDAAATGDAVVAAMQKASSTRLQTDLDALDRLLPRSAPPTLALHTFPSGVVGNRALLAAAFAHTDPAKLPIIVQRRAAVGDIASKWQSIKASSKAPAAVEAGSGQKVDHDLSQMFAGKSKADVDKKRRELSEEARRRFAKDPKTLDKVLKYLATHG